MKRKTLVVALLLAVLTIGLGYFQFFFKPAMIKGFITGAKMPPAVVAAEEAKQESIIPRISAIGTTRAVQGIDVSSQVGGIIRAIRMESGQDVAKGTPLVEIDDSTEQADLKAGLATLKNAELALDRQRQLNAGGNSAKASLDAAQASRDSAAASVERTRAIIAQKAVAAPFAGRLGIRKVDVGQYVSPGTSFVTLQQLNPIYIDFPVPEQNLERLRPGQSVELQVDAFPGKTFAAKIKYVDARVSADTRNVLVRAEADNKDFQLLPGMFANVNVLAGDAAQSVTIPRTGVAYSLYGDSVFVIKATKDKDGADQLIAERRFVRTGDALGDRVIIREGVKAGEKVITQGQLKLQPNARVSIDPQSNLVPPAVRTKE